jgi:hypothetical protein
VNDASASKPPRSVSDDVEADDNSEHARRSRG